MISKKTDLSFAQYHAHLALIASFVLEVPQRKKSIDVREHEALMMDFLKEFPEMRSRPSLIPRELLGWVAIEHIKQGNIESGILLSAELSGTDQFSVLCSVLKKYPDYRTDSIVQEILDLIVKEPVPQDRHVMHLLLANLLFESDRDLADALIESVPLYEERTEFLIDLYINHDQRDLLRSAVIEAEKACNQLLQAEGALSTKASRLSSAMQKAYDFLADAEGLERLLRTQKNINSEYGTFLALLGLIKIYSSCNEARYQFYRDQLFDLLENRETYLDGFWVRVVLADLCDVDGCSQLERLGKIFLGPGRSELERSIFFSFALDRVKEFCDGSFRDYFLPLAREFLSRQTEKLRSLKDSGESIDSVDLDILEALPAMARQIEDSSLADALLYEIEWYVREMMRCNGARIGSDLASIAIALDDRKLFDDVVDLISDSEEKGRAYFSTLGR